jgi:SAM-dependent methyltransferase
MTELVLNQPVHFDHYADDYTDILDRNVSISGRDSKYFAEYKAMYLRRMLGAGFAGKVLDFGCGVGLLSESLRKQLPAAGLNGFDISRSSIAQVDSELALNGVFTSCKEDLADDYDLIVVANVFHHIPVAARKEVMRELSERLAPGGLLCIFEHNPANPVTRWMVAHCPFDDDAVLLPPSETVDRVQQAGLQLKRREYTLFAPIFLRLLLPLETWLRQLPLGAQYAVVAAKEIPAQGEADVQQMPQFVEEPAA